MPKTTVSPTTTKPATRARAEPASALAQRLRAFEDMRFGWPFTEMFAHEWSDLLERTGSLIRIERTMRDGDIVLRAEIPGVDPDKDVQVMLENDLLTIHAVRRDERTEEEAGTRRSEFHYGEATRRMRVPAGTDPDAITATYKDGILEVRVHAPKAVQAERQITVKRAEG